MDAQSRTHQSHQISDLAQLREVIPAPKDNPPAKVMKELDAEAISFLKCSPLVFVATTNRSFDVDVSPKGDAPGFAQAPDSRTLLLPERSGNRLAFGFQNILQTGTIGLIFVVPGVRETLRINGHAVLTRDPSLLERFSANGKLPLLVTQVSIDECFFHCGKALIRSRLWAPSDSDRSIAGRAAAKNWSRVFSLSEAQVDEILEADYQSNL
jgi:PPOX class probable FMN-dependent enzyme